MRTYLSLTPILTLALTLAPAGCAKNQTDETQNPDAVSDGTVDGSEGEGDAATTSSRARGSTATRSGGRHTKARKVTAKKPPRADDPEETPDEGETGPNGLLAEAFSLDAAEGLPDFAAVGDASESFEVPNLDIDETDFTNGFPGSAALKENYALRFTGSINVTQEAEYELCLHSDDGSQLLLEDMLVVDNDGVQEAPVESCELLFLAPGEYSLEVRYFQASGPLLALHFAWAINGGDKVIVPTDVLFKPVSDPSGA